MAASAEDLAMFGSEPTSTQKSKLNPGGASPEDIAMFGDAKPPSTWDKIKGAASSVGSAVGDSFSRLGHTVASAVPAAIDLVSPIGRDPKTNEFGLQVPFGKLADPSYRRQAERGVSDVVTGGAAEKLGNMAPDLFGPKLADTAQDDAQNSPGAREFGNIAGMALPSPFSYIGGQAARIVPGTGALAGAGRGLAAYEGMAVPQAATQAAIGAPSGQRLSSAEDAAVSAATDPAGLVIGPGIGAAGGALARVGERLDNKIGETRGGKARALIEERGDGAKVGLTTPGKGGVFDSALAGIGNDDRAIGTAAERGAEQLVEQIKHDHKVETSRPYKYMKEKIDNSPGGQKLRDVTPLVVHMQNAVDDLETPTFVRAALREQLSLLEKHRTGDVDPVTGEKDGPVMLPERQLNGLRRELMRQSKVGTTDAPGAAEAPLRQAAFEAKRMVDDGPYRRLNELFSQGASDTAARRKLLGLKAKPAKDEQVDINKARLTLQRGEEMSNSNTAGAFADRLRDLGAQNPTYQPSIDLPALARARADLTFKLAPSHGGLMGRAGAGMAPLATGYGLVTHPLATLGGLALANRAPIQGRVLAPIAERLASPHGNPIAIARLIQAARAPGTSRAALQAQADQLGVPSDKADQIAMGAGL